QESLSDLISQSFTTALGKLQNEFGDNRSHWKWGCVNNTHIGHVGQIPGFGRHVFIGGGAESINAIDGSHGPSWRMVVQLGSPVQRSEEHTSELQSRFDLVCRLLLEKKK